MRPQIRPVSIRKMTREGNPNKKLEKRELRIMLGIDRTDKFSCRLRKKVGKVENLEDFKLETCEENIVTDMCNIRL